MVRPYAYIVYAHCNYDILHWSRSHTRYLSKLFHAVQDHTDVHVIYWHIAYAYEHVDNKSLHNI